MGEDLTLGQWLASAQRSMGGGYFGRSSGPLSGYLFGPDFFRKQTYLQVSDTFNATYGKKVWDALNNKTVAFNAVKKVDWGPTVGWRLRTDRGSGRSRPITEANSGVGTLPTIDVSAYTGIYTYPKSIGTTFGVSLKSQAVSALEGGIGNQFAVEQEAASRDHVKEINQELMAGSCFIQCTGSTSGTAYIGSDTTGYKMARSFNIGDTIAASNVVTARTVTANDTAAGTVTAGSFAGAAGNTVMVKSRAGLTALDDIVNDNSTKYGGVTTSGIVVYNLTAGERTADGYGACAYEGNNSGVGRDLSLSLVDTCFQKVREKGGDPKLIITGLDQYDRLNQLLQAQQRFVDVTDYIVGVGDDRTYPGTRAGFQLATYRGTPILPDPDTPISISSAYATLGSNFYVLDTDYLEMAVMYPTQYIENRDYFAANALVIRGMFITMMELRSTRFDIHAKILDLNT